MWSKTSVVCQRPDGDKPGELFTRKLHVLFAIFLAILAGIAGYLQYFGRPIVCWCPPFFTGSMVLYVNSICFFKDGYYVPRLKPIPEPLPPTCTTNYYKWTPFGLLFLAALYIIPEITTRLPYSIFHVRLGNILQLARGSTSGSKEQQEVAIEQLVFDLQYRCRSRGNSGQTAVRRLVNRILPSIPLCIRLQHLTRRLIFAVGSLIPIWFLYKTFKIDFNLYDQVLGSGKNNGSNQTYFPSVVLCDFAIRQISNIQRYTVQCHLSSSDLFAKIGVLVGFLALVVSSASSSDFVGFLLSPFFEQNNTSYISSHLKLLADRSKVPDQGNIYREFAERYLGRDGRYLIQLIGQNSSQAVVSQILSRLWEDYTLELKPAKTSLPPPYSSVTTVI